MGANTPTPPPQQPPLPTITDPAVTEAANNEKRAKLLRAGRASTILTDSGELGNPALQKKTLLGG